MTSIQPSKHPWLPGSLLAIILYRGITNPPQAATGRHRAPTFWAQHPANLLKSLRLRAQTCQLAHLGTLADPVKHNYFHKLAGTIPGESGPTKRSPISSNSCPKRCVVVFPPPTPRSKAQQRTSVQPAQVARQLESRKTSIQGSKHPFLRSWRSAAEAVAFSIY